MLNHLLSTSLGIALIPLLTSGALLSDLEIKQAILPSKAGYQADSKINISFTLTQPSEVTLSIGRHAAVGELNPDTVDTPVLPTPPVVREMKLGSLPAGAHTATWDGLDARGQPIVESLTLSHEEFRKLQTLRSKDPAKAAQPLSQADLIKILPVNLFRITLKAGNESLSGNLQRETGMIPSWPHIAGMIADGRQLPDGDFIVVDRARGFGYRLGPDLAIIDRYPKVEAAWNANRPVEGFAIRADSKGTVYAATAHKVIKYNLDGSDALFTASAPYLNGQSLGIRLDKPAATESKTYSSGGKSIKYDATQAESLLKQPGFATLWGVIAVAPDDNLYVVRATPTPLEIQVFKPSGEYLHSIPLPPSFRSHGQIKAMHFSKDGKLWLGGGTVYRFNTETREIELKLPEAFTSFTLDSHDNVIGWNKGRIVRFTPDGSPLPFTASSPYLVTDGRSKGTLDFLRPEGVTREQDPTRGRLGVLTVIPGNAGNLYVLTCDEANWADFPRLPQTAIHLTHEGKVMEIPLPLAWGQATPGNVFVGDTPACVQMYLSNLSAMPVPLDVSWTLTDLDGKSFSGKQALTVPALTHQSVLVPLPAMTNYGAYEVHAEVRRGTTLVSTLNTRSARIRSRPMETRPDSPFGMVWGTSYYLSGIAGSKKERVGPVDPRQWVLAENLLRPDLPEVTSRRRFGMSGAMADAKRWGLRMPIMLTYGEPYLTQHWMAPIYSYDTWLQKIVTPMVTQFSGPDLQHVQFWNEPDNFLYHPTKTLDREHFALLTKLIWSLCKARDKEGRSIPDADTGYGMMEKTLPSSGGHEFSDAICSHYPGASGVTLTKMTLPGLPEGKAGSIANLLKIRDTYYPGKPLINSEEGWWGRRTITPLEAATSIARVHIPELAAGTDEIYWFAQTSVDDPTYLLGEGNTPWPSYCAYATMTRLLEGSLYIGKISHLAEGTFGYLFARGNECIAALWSVQGEPTIALPCETPQATLTDMMDRQKELKAENGLFTLNLSLQTQYLSVPRTAWATAIAQAELKRQLALLNLPGASAISNAITHAAQSALTNNAAMARLYYLVLAAQQAAFAGEAPLLTAPPSTGVDSAHQFILEREGPDGYLRRSRVALGWARRLARAASTEPQLAWAASLAAEATRSLASQESPITPGAVINAFVAPLGSAVKIRETRPIANKPTTKIDAQFPMQISARAGGSFDLELTLWNFYQHPIDGLLTPRLPAGWKSAQPPQSYSVSPGGLNRFVFTITIPADIKPGLYQVGGQMDYLGQTLHEIHAQRVKID